MLRVRQISIPILEYKEETILKKISQKLKINKNEIQEYTILKQSIDARHKENIKYSLEVVVKVLQEEKIRKTADILEYQKYEYTIPICKENNKKVVIVGSGPAGLFASYILCLAGLKPIILERGKSIENRVLDVETFWQDNVLDENSNVLFGEGGAGTFSDGKLNTLVHDKNNRNTFVLETFTRFGAPNDILYLQKPHIGTDYLRNVIVAMRECIKSMGGEFRFQTCMTDIEIKNGKVVSVTVNDKEKIICDEVVLAIGHSARDTFKLLDKRGLMMESKPFAVGVRVIHPQSVINTSQYGECAEVLPPASYKLTHQSINGHGVYSFCMCPGGYVVNASSKNGLLSINGMSNYKRDTKSSNSAIVVSVSKSDFGPNLFDGLYFQEMLEKRAYQLGESAIPCMTYKDYVNNEITTNIQDIDVCGRYKVCNINQIFPNFINDAIKESMSYFGTKIKGFDDDNTIILGVESRTSSPIRIIRNDDFESNINGIYPCGEGAGYAGGIMTSAMDGMKVAETIIKKYNKV